MRQHRGVGEASLRRYEYHLVDLLDCLGDDPSRFTAQKLRGFVEQREQACQNEKPRLGATGAAEFYGAKFRLKASASGGRLRQMIQQSQKRVAKLAKREQ